MKLGVLSLSEILHLIEQERRLQSADNAKLPCQSHRASYFGVVTKVTEHVQAQRLA
jgi:hypothetical protein